MVNFNEQYNIRYNKMNAVSQEIRILKRILSEKLEEEKDLASQLQELYKEMHKPDFSKITKREIVKCFSPTVKPADVGVQVKVCDMWNTINRVSELEKNRKYDLRLVEYHGGTLEGEISILINKDRSFNLLEP